MPNEPADIAEARNRIRRLIDPYRDEDEISAEMQAKIQGYRNALAVIGGEDRDDRPDHQ